MVKRKKIIKKVDAFGRPYEDEDWQSRMPVGEIKKLLDVSQPQKQNEFDVLVTGEMEVNEHGDIKANQTFKTFNPDSDDEPSIFVN